MHLLCVPVLCVTTCKCKLHNVQKNLIEKKTTTTIELTSQNYGQRIVWEPMSTRQTTPCSHKCRVSVRE